MTETERAQIHFTSPTTKMNKFNFSAFRHKEVRDALNEMFAYKCAYCESKYGATQPVAIEHYRPKSEIHDGGKVLRPGYWWLASDWGNLLPSCSDCNSYREHKWPNGQREALGKGNQFPLAAGHRHARRPQSDNGEVPLLLDPCRSDDPGRILRFHENGVVLPQVDADGQELPSARASIDVYALRRPILIEGRRDYAARVLHQIRHVIKAAKAYEKRPGPKRQAELDDEVAELKRLIADDQPYTTMSRQLVEQRLGL